MPNTRADFTRLLYPKLDQFIWQGWEELTPQFGEIFNEETTNDAFVEDRTAAGTALLQRIVEGGAAAEDKAYDGFPKRYDSVEYGLKQGFTMQAMKDLTLKPIWRDRAKDLGFSGRQTVELIHAAIINLAFTGDNGPDGVPLASAVHPNERGGGTQSNVAATPGKPSQLVARQMLTQIRRYLDSTGVRREQLVLEKWVVPPELYLDALEVMKSTDRPDTANRAINVVFNKLQVFEYSYLTSATMHLMLAAKRQRHLRSLWREKAYTREYETEETMTNWVELRLRFMLGWSSYRGTLFNNAS